ncbi:hypothetical protein CPB84DRAFT_859992 [Gymnopilus junonius]|uniref:Uncharacterized protein n=1 Tax=Gymnopilus junonius TaxID=109634 RepID=A0A9P5NPV6_GYMJU|nr:hypothetical protein CPB84DRAFT_859992 [Gymnopilus junonius]
MANFVLSSLYSFCLCSHPNMLRTPFSMELAALKMYPAIYCFSSPFFDNSDLASQAVPGQASMQLFFRCLTHVSLRLYYSLLCSSPAFCLLATLRVTISTSASSNPCLLNPALMACTIFFSYLVSGLCLCFTHQHCEQDYPDQFSQDVIHSVFFGPCFLACWSVATVLSSLCRDNGITESSLNSFHSRA